MNECVKENLGKPYFDKHTTNVIKGIALIMMFIHHSFTIPEHWLEGIEYPFIEKIAPYFLQPFLLCVSIFCFITGYFYAFNKNRTFKYSLKKISDILVSYFCVFFVFALIAIWNGYRFSSGNFVKECLSLCRSTMIFCWYVKFYIVFMLILPVITKVMSKNIHADLILTLIGIPLISSLLKSFITIDFINGILKNLEDWFPCVLMGYIFAKYDLFIKMQRLNERIIKQKQINIIVWILLILIVPMGRYFELGIQMISNWLPPLYIRMDVVYAPLFIYLAANLSKTVQLKYTDKALFYIGKYSMLMWFVSCIFYNNSKTIFQPMLYKPHNPVIVILWELLLCFAAAYVFDILISKIQKFKNKILFPSK